MIDLQTEWTLVWYGVATIIVLVLMILAMWKTYKLHKIYSKIINQINEIIKEPEVKNENTETIKS